MVLAAVLLGLSMTMLLVWTAGCRPTPAPPTATATVTRQTATVTPTATRKATATPGKPAATATRPPGNGPTRTPRPTVTPTIAPTVTATATPKAPPPGGERLTGYASHYAPGVFERIVADHVAAGYWPEAPDMSQYDGYAATESCDHYRGAVWIRPLRDGSRDAGAWGRFLVADCAGDWDTVAWMQANSIIVEVDAATYGRWQRAGFWTARGLPVEMVIGDN